MDDSGSKQVSYERAALDSLRQVVSGIASVQVFSGHAGDNRFGVPDWELTLGQQFQFGDLRVETPRVTIVVEVESAGGVGNLVKYWPLLATKGVMKRFIILHAFRIGSEGDYIAHRRLWAFLVDRMREDLERRGVSWPRAWEAQMFTYRAGDEPVEIAARLREVVEAELRA